LVRGDGYHELRGFQSGGIPFECVRFSGVTDLIVILGENENYNATVPLPTSDYDASLFDASDVSLLLSGDSGADPPDDVKFTWPDFDSFNVSNLVGPSTDWFVVEPDALVDGNKYGLATITVFLGTGINFATIYPQQSDIILGFTVEFDSSLLYWPPYLPSWISVTSGCYGYDDVSSNAININDTIHLTAVADGITSLQSLIPRIDTLFKPDDVNSPHMNVLNTSLSLSNLLPSDWTIHQLFDLSAAWSATEDLIHDNLVTMGQENSTTNPFQPFADELEQQWNGSESDGGWSSVNVETSTSRSAGWNGYSTSHSFGVTLTYDFNFTTSIEEPKEFQQLGIQEIDGVMVYLTTTLTFNFTIVVVDPVSIDDTPQVGVLIVT
jgi:hypothetical protein